LALRQSGEFAGLFERHAPCVCFRHLRQVNDITDTSASCKCGVSVKSWILSSHAF
jgi:hypothetical protein